MNLAIFDLDHTLLSCDSDVQWAAYLSDKGILSADDAQKREDFYQDYLTGQLDIDAFLKFQLAPLAEFSRDTLNDMHREFMTHYITPHITAQARDLVHQHFNQNDELLLLSATNEFIITPIAHEFGIQHIIGVRLATDNHGNFTGQYVGTPSFREGKVTCLFEWLNARGKSFDDFSKIYFYSDSHNDLPLLDLVNVPIAVNPDAQLSEYATARGWNIISFSES